MTIWSIWACISLDTNKKLFQWSAGIRPPSLVLTWNLFRRSWASMFETSGLRGCMDWVSGLIGGGSGVLKVDFTTRNELVQCVLKSREHLWNYLGIYLPPVDDFNFVFGAEVDVYLIRIIRFHASLLTFIWNFRPKNQLKSLLTTVKYFIKCWYGIHLSVHNFSLFMRHFNALWVALKVVKLT